MTRPRAWYLESLRLGVAKQVLATVCWWVSEWKGSKDVRYAPYPADTTGGRQTEKGGVSERDKEKVECVRTSWTASGDDCEGHGVIRRARRTGGRIVMAHLCTCVEVVMTGLTPPRARHAHTRIENNNPCHNDT